MRRSCLTARCGSSTVPRESFAINPTWRPRLCTCAAIDAARLTAYSTVDSSPSPKWTPRSRSRRIHRSVVRGCSNVFDISRWCLAESGQWIRPKLSPVA